MSNYWKKQRITSYAYDLSLYRDSVEVAIIVIEDNTGLSYHGVVQLGIGYNLLHYRGEYKPVETEISLFQQLYAYTLGHAAEMSKLKNQQFNGSLTWKVNEPTPLLSDSMETYGQDHIVRVGRYQEYPGLKIDGIYLHLFSQGNETVMLREKLVAKNYDDAKLEALQESSNFFLSCSHTVLGLLEEEEAIWAFSLQR